MSATSTDLLSFVRDMDYRGVPPFRSTSNSRIDCIAAGMRQAALAGDARTVAT